MNTQNSLGSLANVVASAGRGPDTQLAHISPGESQFIDYLQGGRRTNPSTGLPEYGLLGNILKAVVRAGATIGAFAISGGNPLAAAAAGSAATKLTGGSWNDALKMGAISGLTAGIGNGISSGGSAFMSNAGLAAHGAGAGLTGLGQSVAAGSPAAAALGVQGTLGSGIAAGSNAASLLGTAGSVAAPTLSSAGIGSGLSQLAAAGPAFTAGTYVPAAMGAGAIAPASALSGTLSGAASAAAPAAGPGFFSGLGAATSSIGGLTGLAVGASPFLYHDEPKAGDPAKPTPDDTFHTRAAHPLQRTYNPYIGNIQKYGQSNEGEHSFFTPNAPAPVVSQQPMQAPAYYNDTDVFGSPNQSPQFLADGGSVGANSPDTAMLRQAAMQGYMMAKAGGTVKGRPGGKADYVPAMLSNNEHVIDSSTISDLGDGDPDEGHRRMEAFKEEIRRRAGRKNPKKPTPSQGSLGSIMRVTMNRSRAA